MDEISCLLEAVHDVVRVLDRLVKTSNGERDFQLLISKLDYLQRIVVNLDIDDFVTEIIGRAYSLLIETDRVRQSECGGYRASVHGSGTSGKPSFDISKEQLSFFNKNTDLTNISFQLQHKTDSASEYL